MDVRTSSKVGDDARRQFPSVGLAFHKYGTVQRSTSSTHLAACVFPLRKTV